VEVPWEEDAVPDPSMEAEVEETVEWEEAQTDDAVVATREWGVNPTVLIDPSSPDVTPRTLPKIEHVVFYLPRSNMSSSIYQDRTCRLLFVSRNIENYTYFETYFPVRTLTVRVHKFTLIFHALYKYPSLTL